jgi:hypothetical protein
VIEHGAIVAAGFVADGASKPALADAIAPINATHVSCCVAAAKFNGSHGASLDMAAALTL